MLRDGHRLALLGPALALFLYAAPRAHPPQISQASPTSDRGGSAAASLLKRYVAGDRDAVARELLRIESWNVFANEVVKNVEGGPAEAAAAFALEAAAACQDASFQEVELGGGPRHPMLRAGWKRVSASAKSAFVLAWVEATSSLVQGTGGEQPFQYFESTFDSIGMLDAAARRFPGQSGLRLARAMVLSRRVHVHAAEGWFSDGGRQYLARQGRRGDPWPADDVADAVNRFLPLIDDPIVGPDAMLHLGYLRHLQGRSRDAIELLARVEDRTKDPWLLYLGHFFQGQILTSQRAYSQARLAFQRALDLYPTAASGRRALASLRYLDGDRASALQLVDVSPDSPSDGRDDPWLWFAYGEYRHWPERMARVRSLLQ
jgi:tetratricopeptide (TPR) repeat protein